MASHKSNFSKTTTVVIFSLSFIFFLALLGLSTYLFVFCAADSLTILLAEVTSILLAITALCLTLSNVPSFNSRKNSRHYEPTPSPSFHNEDAPIDEDESFNYELLADNHSVKKSDEDQRGQSPSSINSVTPG